MTLVDLLERLRFPILGGLILSVAIAAAIVLLRLPGYTETVEISLPTPSPAAGKEVKVYVTGAVAKAGVYELAGGSRVEDAVKAAGGMTAEANADAINLAARVRDEMHVHVPQAGELSAGTGAGGAVQKISINSASAAQLESLPGIGQVTAKLIVDHRSKNGPFKTIEELRDLKLVNASTFEKIKDLIAP